MFGHEKFEAYKLSVEFVKLAVDLAENIPTGNSSLKDQLKRAASSVPLNIAEGSGKIHRPDCKRFYSIARGSAMECAAICDVISVLDGDLKPKTDRGKKLLDSIVAILTTVCSN